MTNQKNNHFESALKAGLTARVATVYVTLLEAQAPLSPKAVIGQTGLHRQYVYDALDDLIVKGLVVREGDKKRVTYLATSPDRLLRELEKQRLDTIDGVKDLMHLYDRSPAGTVDVIRGSRAVIEDEMIEMRSAQYGEFLDIIGGAGMHWVELFGSHVSEWEKVRKEKKIKLRYIGSGKDVQYNREISIIEHESKLIPGIGDIVNVVIRPESVSFTIYVPEVMTVRVKNRDAVLSQRALFEILWNVAK